MILDKLAQLSSTQAITATAAATNVYDTGMAERDLGAGEPLAAVFNVEEAFNNLNDLSFTVRNSATVDGNGALSGTIVEIATTKVLQAALTVGKIVVVPIPPGQNLLKYVGAVYTVNGTNPSTGKVSGYIVPLKSITVLPL